MIRGTPGLSSNWNDPQSGTPVFLCSRCMGEMYCGEPLFVWEDKQICTDCFKAAATAWLNEAPSEAAFGLGVEMRLL